MTATLTMRIDSADKKNFEAFCKSVGLTPSSAISLFVKATLREGEIPFAIRSDPFYSKENMKRLEKNAREMEKTGGKQHEVITNDKDADR